MLCSCGSNKEWEKKSWNIFLPFFSKNQMKSEKCSTQKIQWRKSPTHGQQNLINNQYSIWFFFLNRRKSNAFRSDLLSLVSAHFDFGYYYLLMMKSWILSTAEKEILNDFLFSLVSRYLVFLVECSSQSSHQLYALVMEKRSELMRINCFHWRISMD